MSGRCRAGWRGIGGRGPLGRSRDRGSRRRQTDKVKIDLLVVFTELILDIGITDGDAGVETLTDLIADQFVTLHNFKCIAVQTLVSKDLKVAIFTEDAVLLKSRNLGYCIDQLLVADIKLESLCFILQQCLIDHAVDRLLCQFQLFLQRWGELVLVNVLVELVEVAVG